MLKLRAMGLMNKKHLLIIVFLSFTLMLVIYLICPSDKKRIKALFDKGAGAAESEDLEAVMSKVSYNYQDDYGMTYLYLKVTLKRQFEVFSDIDVEYNGLNIQVSGDKAQAGMDLRVIATMGNETGYIIGDIKTPVHLMFSLEKEGTKWLIVKTEGFNAGYGKGAVK